jgi:hypothetical protein
MPEELAGKETLSPEAEKHVEQTPEEVQASLDRMSDVEADETVSESLPETKDNILHAEKKPELEAAEEVTPAITAGTGSRPALPPKDEAVIEVEKILEDGIGPFYASLPPEARPLFKQKGEEAANEISEMVRTLHMKVKRILELIYMWLKTIPGVNKFFLEQEAKIKTDRIVELIEARREEGAGDIEKLSR